MNKGWKTVAIGDICEAIYDGPHATPKKTTEGPIFLGISNLQNGQINLSDVDHLSEDDFIKWTRRVTPRANDIVFSYETRLGEAALVPVGMRFCLGRRMALIRPDTKKVDPRFLLYAYLGPEFQQILHARTVFGSTVNRIPLIEFPTFPISIPSISEQRAIAGILGALDDKIELNRRMNRTLESMARAVFREWFVESEEVGDWNIGKLGDVVVNFDSKRVPLSKREREKRQGKFPYYGAASVMDYVDDYLFDGNYVLMAEDGSVIGVDDHPVIQYVWGKFWVNNHAHVLQGINRICNEYLYLFLKEINILPYVTGAVQPKLNQANMNSIPFVIPPKKLSKKFEEYVSPLFARIRSNEEESRTLTNLRDTLLPKLMRGEVRVKS